MAVDGDALVAGGRRESRRSRPRRGGARCRCRARGRRGRATRIRRARRPGRAARRGRPICTSIWVAQCGQWSGAARSAPIPDSADRAPPAVRPGARRGAATRRGRRARGAEVAAARRAPVASSSRRTPALTRCAAPAAARARASASAPRRSRRRIARHTAVAAASTATRAADDGHDDAVVERRAADRDEPRRRRRPATGVGVALQRITVSAAALRDGDPDLVVAEASCRRPASGRHVALDGELVRGGSSANPLDPPGSPPATPMAAGCCRP